MDAVGGLAALDWIFIAVLVASMVLGAWRGLVYEVLSLLGWVVAFFAAQWFAEDAAGLLPLGERSDAVRHAAGFVVVFIGAIFACGLLAWLAKKVIEAVGLRPADRSLGALFGVLRGVVLLLAVALVGLWTPLQEAGWWQESRVAPWLTQALRALRPALPEDLGRHLPS